ncbi:alpha/beta hydrolase-fold protein [Kribbella sp. NPDC051718]|uniref:alpha/beta hydrolase n=1 Tax=Kribbella sp. NPDC051718 TaxID=3155168 RepID=UPI00341FEBC0
MALEVSLLSGWLPWTLESVAVVALVLAVGWRDARWRTRKLPLIVVGAAVAGLLTARVVLPASGVTDPLPLSVWLWFGVVVGALLVLIVGWNAPRRATGHAALSRTVNWRHRGAAVVAATLAAIVCANGVNQFVGYFPTVGDAVAGIENKQVPGEVSLHQLTSKPDPVAQKNGKLVKITIPATPSGFKHRPELVWLPPAWFQKSRPALPAVEMIAAEHSKPENWIRIGQAVRTAEAYAARHHGAGPILVFVDPTGGFGNDTECVNGPHGQAEDHLVLDVPQYVEKHFGASTDPRRWAIAGFSMGGTCAIGLVTEHPEAFRHFLDISGDEAPNTGDEAQTVANLFGGSQAAYDVHAPLTVMVKHGPYPPITGQYLDGTEELTHIRVAKEFITAGKKVGITSTLTVQPGGHNWQFATQAFTYAYPWLADQLLNT